LVGVGGRLWPFRSAHLGHVLQHALGVEAVEGLLVARHGPSASHDHANGSVVGHNAAFQVGHGSDQGLGCRTMALGPRAVAGLAVPFVQLGTTGLVRGALGGLGLLRNSTTCEQKSEAE
jgi:hypothetical protein